MLMEIDPSPDERSIGDDDGDDFPLREGSFPGGTAPPEPQIGSAKVPPRSGGVSSEKKAYDFFSIERLHIAEDAPSWAGCGPPGESLPLSIFYIF